MGKKYWNYLILIMTLEKKHDVVLEMESKISKHLKEVNAPSKHLDILNIETEDELIKARLKGLGYL